MKRREFIKLSACSVLMACLNPLDLFSKETTTPGSSGYRFKGARLPLLARVDTLLVGGGFSALGAALRLAEAGRKCLIIDTKTFLGDEVTAYSHLTPRHDAAFEEFFGDCLETFGDERVIHAVKVKRQAEIRLEQAGAEWLYGVTPIRIQPCSEGYIVVVADKSGLQAIVTRQLVDASPTALTQYLLGGTPALKRAPGMEITIELTDCGLEPGRLQLPERLGVEDNGCRVFPGYADARHRFVTLAFASPQTPQGAEEWIASNSAEVEVRQKAFEVVKYLVNEVAACETAYFVHLSYYVRHRYEVVDRRIMELEPIARDLWIAHPELGGYCAATAFGIGRRIAGRILADDRSGASSRGRQHSVDGPELPVAYLTDPVRGIDYEMIETAPFELRLRSGYDVLVAGGGTSGATAAAVAGRYGLKTLMVEQIHGVGGTGTFGGVHIYWFGRRGGFNKELNRDLEVQHRAIRYKQKSPGKWNIEAKNYVLCRELLENECDLSFHSFACAALVERGRIQGAVVATPFGPYAVESRYTIDATGDGDVAAFAGASFDYGSRHNHFPMYYAFCFSRERGNYRTRFDAMLNTTNLFDINRVIRTNRRIDVDCDHAPFVATRETRHIHGDVTLTLADQFLFREWDDVVNIHFSNNDIKGHHSSDWLRLGFQQPNYEVEIPYRALLPRGLDNLLVVGKAFSVDHDAYPTLRMQPDLENLGGVAAVACFEARRADVTLRHLPMKRLQRRLVELDILPFEVLTRTVRPHELSEQEIEALIAQLDCRPLYTYSDMPMDAVFRERIPFIELCSAGEAARNVLERALEREELPKRRQIARILAFIGGSEQAADVLIDEIDEILSRGVLPAKEADIAHSNHMPPNQCAMPSLGYLLNMLAMCRSKEAPRIWKRVIDLLPLHAEALADDKSGLFYYVDALCYGMALLPSQEAADMLEELHTNALFHQRFAPQNPGDDPLEERRALLELEITTSLARCGSPHGYSTLADYLNDCRSILAEYAHATLRELTGTDFGKYPQRWKSYLASKQTFPLQPAPRTC